MCARCLYNEWSPDAPFDYGAPHEISKTAFFLAHALGIRNEEVIEILALHEKKSAHPTLADGQRE